MVTNSTSQGRKKLRTVLSVAFLVVFLFLAMSFFFFLFAPRNPIPTLTAPTVTSSTPFYLPYQGNTSHILLVTATAAYGTYPGPSVPQMGSTPGVKKGDPCLIINATIQNDYSTANPLPDQNVFNLTNSSANLYLTAQIFNNHGQVKATDVTPPYPTVPLNGAFVSLASGENATLTMYLATSHMDLTHFTIVLEYVGSVPPP